MALKGLTRVHSSFFPVVFSNKGMKRSSSKEIDELQLRRRASAWALQSYCSISVGVPASVVRQTWQQGCCTRVCINTWSSSGGGGGNRRSTNCRWRSIPPRLHCSSISTTTTTTTTTSTTLLTNSRLESVVRRRNSCCPPACVHCDISTYCPNEKQQQQLSRRPHALSNPQGSWELGLSVAEQHKQQQSSRLSCCSHHHHVPWCVPMNTVGFCPPVVSQAQWLHTITTDAAACALAGVHATAVATEDARGCTPPAADAYTSNAAGLWGQLCNNTSSAAALLTVDFSPVAAILAPPTAAFFSAGTGGVVVATALSHISPLSLSTSPCVGPRKSVRHLASIALPPPEVSKGSAAVARATCIITPPSSPPPLQPGVKRNRALPLKLEEKGWLNTSDETEYDILHTYAIYATGGAGTSYEEIGNPVSCATAHAGRRRHVDASTHQGRYVAALTHNVYEPTHSHSRELVFCFLPQKAPLPHSFLRHVPLGSPSPASVSLPYTNPKCCFSTTSNSSSSTSSTTTTIMGIAPVDNSCGRLSMTKATSRRSRSTSNSKRWREQAGTVVYGSRTCESHNGWLVVRGRTNNNNNDSSILIPTSPRRGRSYRDIGMSSTICSNTSMKHGFKATTTSDTGGGGHMRMSCTLCSNASMMASKRGVKATTTSDTGSVSESGNIQKEEVAEGSPTTDPWRDAGPNTFFAENGVNTDATPNVVGGVSKNVRAAEEAYRMTTEATTMNAMYAELQMLKEAVARQTRRVRLLIVLGAREFSSQLMGGLLQDPRLQASAQRFLADLLEASEPQATTVALHALQGEQLQCGIKGLFKKLITQLCNDPAIHEQLGKLLVSLIQQPTVTDGAAQWVAQELQRQDVRWAVQQFLDTAVLQNEQTRAKTSDALRAILVAASQNADVLASAKEFLMRTLDDAELQKRATNLLWKFLRRILPRWLVGTEDIDEAPADPPNLQATARNVKADSGANNGTQESNIGYSPNNINGATMQDADQTAGPNKSIPEPASGDKSRKAPVHRLHATRARLQKLRLQQEALHTAVNELLGEEHTEKRSLIEKEKLAELFQALHAVLSQVEQESQLLEDQTERDMQSREQQFSHGQQVQAEKVQKEHSTKELPLSLPELRQRGHRKEKVFCEEVTRVAHFNQHNLFGAAASDATAAATAAPAECSTAWAGPKVAITTEAEAATGSTEATTGASEADTDKIEADTGGTEEATVEGHEGTTVEGPGRVTDQVNAATPGAGAVAVSSLPPAQRRSGYLVAQQRQELAEGPSRTVLSKDQKNRFSPGNLSESFSTKVRPLQRVSMETAGGGIVAARALGERRGAAQAHRGDNFASTFDSKAGDYENGGTRDDEMNGIKGDIGYSGTPTTDKLLADAATLEEAQPYVGHVERNVESPERVDSMRGRYGGNLWWTAIRKHCDTVREKQRRTVLQLQDPQRQRKLQQQIRIRGVPRERHRHTRVKQLGQQENASETGWLAISKRSGSDLIALWRSVTKALWLTGRFQPSHQYMSTEVLQRQQQERSQSLISEWRPKQHAAEGGSHITTCCSTGIRVEPRLAAALRDLFREYRNFAVVMAAAWRARRLTRGVTDVSSGGSSGVCAPSEQEHPSYTAHREQ